MEKLQSFHQRRLILPPAAGSFTAEGQASRWSNPDLDPVPKHQKKWEWYHVGGFWIAEGFSAAQIQTASASVALGLNPGTALIAYLIGNILVMMACCGSGYIGSKYSINFPVFSRASFGLRGSYLPIVIRAVVAPIWYGIQAYVGALAVQAMIEAIWPSFVNWHADALPASADVTAAELLSFSVFWLASVPFLFLGMPALRWMFLIKGIVMPIFGICLFTWAVTASHGFGPLLRIPTKIENGMSVGYAFCYAITTAISAGSTFTLNIPDLTRYARDPRTATIAQAISLPVCMTLIYFLGVVMAASSQVIYGQIQWNPITIVLSWDNRAAKFFTGLLFAFAMIGTNVAGNSIAFANDTMALFPKYINLRRGQLLCAILGFVICPWKIEARAQHFLAFLNGYSAPFLGPVAGVLLCDFYLVRRCNDFNIHQLYKPTGLYWYTAGINVRALAAFVVGMVPQLPGLAYQINPTISGVSRNYVDFTSLGWLEGLIFSGCVSTFDFFVQTYSTIGSPTICCAYYSRSQREPMKKI
ncbi:permease for cytosine/purines, uracil, thiamine, allantoin-domain-containing protein [Usnea florida]